MGRTLEIFEAGLVKCEDDPVVFFGDDPDDKLREIRSATHPDLYVGDSVVMQRATEIFKRFSLLHALLSKVEFIGDYRVIREVALGDLCRVYRVEKGGNYFVLKLPRVKATSFISHEFETCKRLSSGSTVHSMMVPKPVELVEGDVSIYRWCDNLVSGSSVIGKYGVSLDSRHVVWMFKRALMVLGFAHNEGVVHGAVTPDHLLFSKHDHGLIMCGWVHSGGFDGPVKIVPAKWKHYYPEEVIKGKRLSTSLDIFMTAKSMIDIGGVNLHPRVRRFLDTCLLPVRMRPSNAWELHDEVKEMARDVFGEAKFVELT